MVRPSGCGAKPGDVLGGRYVLREPIGEGGMGVVFRAEQRALARSVAVKILHPRFADNAELVTRFRNEAIAASRIRHCSCVHVVDASALVDGTPYIVMEYVDGVPLGQVLEEGPPPLPRAIVVILQILGAIAAAHDAGVIHADIKADNVLVARDHGHDHVVLIDFGLARTLDEDGVPSTSTVRDRVVSGTPEYMAPEVIQGHPPTKLSDIYGAGVILYELLTGDTPFSGGSTSEILARHVDDPVRPPSVLRGDLLIPAVLDDITLRALAKDPEARYRSADDFAQAIRAAGVLAHPGRYHVQSPRPAPQAPPAQVPALRRAIGAALARGNVGEIAEGYARLADTFVQAHQYAAAVAELAEGIDILTAGRGPSAAHMPAAVGRLVVALAALYEEIGDVRRARRIAAPADHQPTLPALAPSPQP